MSQFTFFSQVISEYAPSPDSCRGPLLAVKTHQLSPSCSTSFTCTVHTTRYPQEPLQNPSRLYQSSYLHHMLGVTPLRNCGGLQDRNSSKHMETLSPSESCSSLPTPSSTLTCYSFVSFEGCLLFSSDSHIPASLFCLQITFFKPIPTWSLQ